MDGLDHIKDTRQFASLLEESARRMRGDGPVPCDTCPRKTQEEFDKGMHQ
jgi:hypothetical protein